MSDEKKIDFLVIGAQKCATTWLYDCLKEHPEICLPVDKREIEYLGGELYKKKGAEWYFSLIAKAKPGQIKGDVSVEYIFNSESPAIVKDLVPGVKIIASLRNPAERAVSAYYWYLRKKQLDINQSIVEVFTHLKECYLANKMDTPCIDIITRGMYDLQLKNYLNCFPPEQLMVIYYNEINNEPLNVLNKLCRFLNIADDFVPKSLNVRPKQNSYLKGLLWLERLGPKSRVISKISNTLNQLMASKKAVKYSAAEIEAYNIINDLFTKSIDATRKIINSLPKPNQPLQPSSIENWKKVIK